MRPTGERGARGASILEFAFVAPVLAIILFGVVDLSRAYQLQIRLDSAAREGARHAMVHPGEVDCTDTDEDVVGKAATEDPGLVGRDGYAVTVSVEAADGTMTEAITGCDTVATDPGDRVRVEVEANHHILTPLIGSIVGNTLTVHGTSEIEVLG